MQNSNPSRNSLSYPSLLQQLLARTFLGGRPATARAAPTPGDIPGADVAPGDDQADDDTGIGVDADDTDDIGDTGNRGDSAGQLELAELVGVMRDPIAWVFTLAERRAQGDPVDIAAIHRVRDAVLHRVDETICGVTSAESPRIRSADLLTVGSLLIDTLDPSLVQRAMRGVRTSLVDALTAMTQVEFAGHLASTAAPNLPPATPSWYPGSVPMRPVGPFGYGAPLPYASMPYGGPCVASFAAPHVLRPVAPPWWWSQSPFAF